MKKPSRHVGSWHARLNQLVTQLVKGNKNQFAYASANCEAIKRAVKGFGPDSDKDDPRAGARMVVNLSSAYVPAFCEASAKGTGKPYKNGYDLEPVAARKGLPLPVSLNRRVVDEALPLPAGLTPNDIYFGAVELNGAGIRFYGDICLVLKREAVPEDTIVLDRNSYDLLRSPAKEQIARLPISQQPEARKATLRRWSGEWARDVGAMAAVKALSVLGLRSRRMTTGQISEAVREDEDYIEVLKRRSFAAADLQEARVSAAEAAHDALVGSRLSKRPMPRLEALIWRNRRSRAEAALRQAGIPLRIVTGAGRTRG